MKMTSRRRSPQLEIETPQSEYYSVLGVTCAVFTNSEEILAATRQSFRIMARPDEPCAMTMRLWEDNEVEGSPPWPQPFFRGLSHLVYVGFDAGSCALLDTRRRHVIGRFGPAMTADCAYWQRAILPTLIGLMSESLGAAALHCACVERSGNGLLLAGGSGAGKSTLSLAMAQLGFGFLSDDWTYFSRSQGRLRAWGLATPVKLLPDVSGYFSQLQALEPGISLNGECAYEVDPEVIFGVRRSFSCEPRWLVFLERHEDRGFSFEKMTAREVGARMEQDLEDLPRELSHVMDIQMDAIQTISGRDCWLLRCGGSPHEIARVLDDFCAGGEPAAALHSK
jgi:hypothetical protein